MEQVDEFLSEVFTARQWDNSNVEPNWQFWSQDSLFKIVADSGSADVSPTSENLYAPDGSPAEYWFIWKLWVNNTQRPLSWRWNTSLVCSPRLLVVSGRGSLSDLRLETGSLVCLVVCVFVYHRIADHWGGVEKSMRVHSIKPLSMICIVLPGLLIRLGWPAELR